MHRKSGLQTYKCNIDAMSLKCPYCNAKARLAERVELGENNGKGAPLSEFVWVCENYPKCDSYVGCYPNSEDPLGTLANKELRILRMKAHKAFDWVWESGRMTRPRAYEAMRKIMGLPPEVAHIGLMNDEQCQQIIEVFTEYRSVTCGYKIPKPM